MHKKRKFLPRVLGATLQSRRGSIRVATTAAFAALLALLFNAVEFLSEAALRLNKVLVTHDTVVTVVAFIAVLVLAVVLYLHIDYQAHKRPLVVEDKLVDYSFRNHVRVVTFPLMIMKWRQFAISCLALSVGFTAYIGISVTMSKGTLAAPGALSVTINQMAGTADPSPSYTTIFTTVFSEPINKATFTSADITLSGTATGKTVQSLTEAGSFNGTTFEVRVQATGAGTIQSSVSAELVTAQNGASGTNQASTSTDNTVTYNASYAPDEFVIQVKTDNPGQTGSNQFRIQTCKYVGIGCSSIAFNYQVDWGDGVVTGSNTTDAIHTYPSAGTYTVKITGLFPGMTINGGYDNRKLVSIEQWGTNHWALFNGAFAGTSNLDMRAIDAPDLTNSDININGVGSMFAGSSMNGAVNHWDVSGITNLSAMFQQAASFNQPVNNWDVSNVTEMQSVFAGAVAFDQPLNSWNISNVTSIGNMFNGANSFNQPLISWDTGNVLSMQGTFSSATSFNQPLSSWDVSSIETTHHMFSGATSFNQPFNNWNSTSLQYTSGMFAGATAFNQTVDIDTSNVVGMTEMFSGATAFNQSLNGWDVSNVTSMNDMFSHASSFNQPLNSWDTGSVLHMSYMFSEATAFDQSLGNWDVSSVTDMLQMFAGTGLSTPHYDSTLIAWSTQPLQNAVTFSAGSSEYCASETQRQNIITTHSWVINDAGKECPFVTTWKTDNPGDSASNQIMIPTISGPYTYDYDVDWGDNTTSANVTTSITHTYASPGTYTVKISGAFPSIQFCDMAEAQKLLTIEQWGTGAWERLDCAFSGATNLTIPATDAPNLSFVTDISYMFRGAVSLNSDLESWDVSHINLMGGMFSYATAFNQPLDGWNVENVTHMGGMFAHASSFNQPLNGWNTDSVVNMGGMFSYATVFNQDIGGWTTDNVTNMGGMFSYATAFNQPLNNWEVGNVTDMGSMFGGATSFDQSIGGWSVSNLTNAVSMFQGASAFNQPLDGWTTSSLTDVWGMFMNATSFNQDINDWDVTHVIATNNLFYGATSFNQPLNNWEVGNVTDMGSMFGGATSFDQSLGDWDVGTAVNLGQMFSLGSGLSTVNYDATLIGWNALVLQNDVNFGAGTSRYCTAEAERQNIIDTFDWNIVDQGNACAPQRPLIMKVKTDNPGDSGNNEFEVTYGNDSDTYDFDVDCDNDGTPEFTHQTYSVVCSYPSAGEYEVAVSGVFPHMALNSGNGHDAEKILEVQQWGDIEWHSMEGMFWGASNVQVTAVDSPDLQAVTNMSAMFYEATTFNANIGSWDTSNVTNMAMMFYGATAFNQSLNGWSTGNVTNMGEMFKEASSFNANISSWNTGNVTNMFGMFSDGSIFNQDISGWNTGNVTDMSELFFSNSHFNQPIGQWQTGSVTAMRRMFGSAANFNQDIGGWNVGNVTNMSEMFNMATTFNQPLGSWNTGSVTDMSSMFTFATVFSQPINSWNVGNVTNMAMMFNSAPQFNQPLSNWNIDQVTTMQSMFGSFVDYMEFYYGPVADWDQNFKTMVFDELSQIVGHTMNEQNYQTLDSGMSTANYDDTLIGWSARSLQDDVIFDAGYSRYCTAEVQRQSMIDTFSWTINDDGKNCQGYLPTDMSLATTLANSGTIKVGDTLNYTLTVRNHGPNNGYDNYDASVLTLLPATMEFVSAAGALPVNCTVVMAEDIGIPAFVQHYSGLQVVFCIWTPTPLLTPGDTTTLNIQTKLKSTVQNGNEVKLRSLLYWYNDIDRNTVEYALDNGEDVYGLTVNFVSNYAFTYTATPDVPDVPNPQAPTNPNPPGTPIPPRTTTPSPIVKGVCDALTVRTVGSDSYAVPLAVAYTVETTGDTTGTTYVYDFGDGTTQESPDKVVEHTYDKWGTYSAAVRLKTGNGLAEQNPLCSVRLGVGQVVAKESVSSFGGALASVRTHNLLTRTIALLPFVFTSLLLLIAMIYLWLAYRDKKQQDKLKELLERNRKTRQSISNFVAISSHYLNTPLATMQGALEILTAAKQKGTLTSITTYTLDGIRKQLQGLSNYVQGIVGQNESVLQADTKQVGSVSIVELAKTKRIWMPLAITGLMIAIIDIGLTLSGGYKLAELRLANAVAFFALAGISIVVAGIMRSRSEALRAGIEQELASEKTLLSQKQALIHDIARQLESYQHLLIQESATVQQLPEGRLFFNGLKDFGKLTQSLISGARFATLSASPQSILATEIITSVVTSLDPVAKQKNVTIQSTIEPEVTMQLEGSEARFLLTAFLDNAIKFSPENAKVELQARRHGKHDIFTIRDGGPSIDQTIVSQLSQPFTRGTDTITYNNQGLGLGLYNAKILIEKLGGSLDLAASTQGTGTVATITLPHANSLPTSMVYAPA